MEISKQFYVLSLNRYQISYNLEKSERNPNFKKYISGNLDQTPQNRLSHGTPLKILRAVI